MQSHIPPQTLLRYLAIQSIQISLAKVLTFKQLSQKYINRAFLDLELNFFFFSFLNCKDVLPSTWL